MRNLKKFLAVVLAIAVMATSMVSAFAADTATDPLAEKYPEAALCRDLGVLQGSTGVTEAYLASKPVRIQAAVLTLRLMGVETTAREYAGLAHFNDNIADNYWAKNIMGYLKSQPKYGWRGDAQGRMNPELPISKKEFQKVLVTVLGYPEPLWDEVEGAYKAAGLSALNDADSAITMNDIAVAIVEALKTPVKGSTDTLAWKLSLSNETFKAAALASGLIKAVTIKSVFNPSLGSVQEGAVVVPPSTVVATMSDGSTKDVAVTWEAAKFDTSKAGDVSMKGTIEGYKNGATATLKVVAATITSVVAVDLGTVYTGDEVVLPETVKANFSNGTVADVAVTWEAAVDTTKAGDVSVKGTVAGFEAGVTATGKVEELVIEEVAALEDVTVNEGGELVLSETVEATYNNGEVADVAVEWDVTEVDVNVPATYEVAGTVEGFEAGAAVKVVVAPVALDFTLSADNYREVTVTFNKAVAADKVKAANFAVTGKNIDAVVALDSKTVRLTTDAPIAKQGQFEVKVKTGIGMAADSTKKSAVVVDGTVPEVVNVEAVGNSIIKITFSEPIQTGYNTLSNFKLNNAYFGAPAPDFSDLTDRVVLVKPTVRMSAGVNKISFSGLADAAGWNIAPVVDKEFVVATDTTAPAFVSVESATQTKVVIVMNEEIVAPADADVVSVPNETNRTVDGNKLTLNYGIGAAAVPVNGLTVTLKNITDTYGNKAADFTVSIPAPTLDLAKPAFVSAVSEGNANVGMKIVATFDKDVQVGGTFTLKDADGNAVAVSVAQRYNDATGAPVATKLFVSGTIPAGTYKLSISGVKDSSGLENVMLPVADYAVTVADKTAPVVSAWYLDTAAKKLYVVFDTVVTEATAENKANYSYVDGANLVNALNADTTVTLLADNKTVAIAFDASVVLTSVRYIQVANVADASSNALLPVNQQVYNAAAVPPAYVLTAPTALTATAAVTGKNTIVVTFSNNIVPSSVSVTDWAVNAGPATVRVYNATVSANKITLTTVEDMTTAAKVGANAVVVSTAASVAASDAFGQKLAVNTALATSDAYKPTVAILSAVGTAAVVGPPAVAANTVITLQASEALVNTNANADKQFVVVVDGALKAYTTAWDAVNNRIAITIAGEDLTGKVVAVKYYTPAANAISDGTNALANFELVTGAVE